MPRYRHILVAFDGSPDAELALDHAVALAQALRARLALVAVVPPPPPFAWQAPGGIAQACTRRSRRTSTSGCAGRRQRARTTLGDDRLLDGDPPREILRAAREGDHDLIVLGSRGRGRVLRGAARERVAAGSCTTRRCR